MDTKKIFKAAMTLAVVFVLILLLYHCPFSYLFGLSCPGCGMTRAFFSLLQLRFAEAFYYHPLFPLVILLALGYSLIYFRILRISDRTKRPVLTLSCALFILVYFIRLFSGHPVVAWDKEKSLFYRIFRCIFMHY